MSEFKTRKGRTLKLKPISMMLMAKVAAKADLDFDTEHGRPEAPTYETSVGETLKYDEAGIGDDLATAEDKAAWADFKRKVAQKSKFVYDRITDAYLWLGVEDEPDGNDWEQSHRLLGIDIPEDEMEYKVCWLRDEILVSETEVQDLSSEIRKLADPVEVEADIAARTFRDSVADSGGTTP